MRYSINVTVEPKTQPSASSALASPRHSKTPLRPADRAADLFIIMIKCGFDSRPRSQSPHPRPFGKRTSAHVKTATTTTTTAVNVCYLIIIGLVTGGPHQITL